MNQRRDKKKYQNIRVNTWIKILISNFMKLSKLCYKVIKYFLNWGRETYFLLADIISVLKSLFFLIIVK